MRVTLSFKTIGCVLMLFSLPSPPVVAQQSPDSAYSDRSTALLQLNVRNELGPDSRLYNGYEYIRNGTPAKGFPFLASDSLMTGDLSYDGAVYLAIPMEYDLVLDKVIIRDYSGKALISLISERVDGFTFGPHHFRYIAGIENPGFYEVLFSSETPPSLPASSLRAPSHPAGAPAPAASSDPGPSGSPAAITLLARREKKLIFPSNREEQARYDQRNSYYLQLGRRFFEVDNKDALLDALKDKKETLKKFISANKLHFKQQLETSLIRTTAYYTHLSH